MVGKYAKSARALSEQETHDRILRAAVQTIETKQRVRVRDVAAKAGVSVQTVYAHFGSKGNLIMAVFGHVSATEGLLEGLGDVWTRTDGQSALSAMIGVTLDFFHRAWPFVGVAMTMRRTDAEFASKMAVIDQSRLHDLTVIGERLEEEGRLAASLTPTTAAALGFALAHPHVYEELVVEGRWPFAAARDRTIAIVTSALIDSDCEPSATSAPGWLTDPPRPPMPQADDDAHPAATST